MASLEIVDYVMLEAAASDVGVRERVVRALGGAGMIAVRNVPGLEYLRSVLLPQARTLALMPDLDRKSVLKENLLGSDVPLKRKDRLVSSFVAQLPVSRSEIDRTPDQLVLKTGELFRHLGYRLIDVGVRVARVCDTALPGLQLEKTILGSQTAKGRLIHYHSECERLPRPDPAQRELSGSEFWQQWHYDYGVLTVLTAPVYINASGSVGQSHSSLVAMDSWTGSVTAVNIPDGSVLVQVGEAAQIFSGGKLRATAHCVVKPQLDPEASRETFVVFLQPAWDKALSCQVALEDGDETGSGDNRISVIPPLETRWKKGCTFAEFSKQTTGQYYGSKGIQSNKT
ncbi:uncharacterized protein LOC9636892 [Selaginella moellendorffii]|nr:uncharacterized protein LOC9636892 [Selaginella moellendorffii]XP_024535185.1 uncharacterized protein LOC9636892 [Selaginella moellendorffii]XP_024535186.1 uncharacterized protein LOC9636892 [Selaginella moellendorffii]XP_024535187.1 uncharacterized protein LOC9636892 [Selaginella moellendorffii]|eukprot:XP_002974660.2 uncharacterized protein LOC9636892 [Selaginella moellendorffii]